MQRHIVVLYPMTDHHKQLKTILFLNVRNYCFFLTDRWGAQHAYFYFYSSETAMLRLISENLYACLRSIHSEEPVSVQEYIDGWNLAKGLNAALRQEFMDGLNQRLIGFEVKFISSVEELVSGDANFAKSLRVCFRAQCNTSFNLPSAEAVLAHERVAFDEFLLHYDWARRLH